MIDEIDEKYYLPHKRDDESIEDTRKRVDDEIIKRRFMWIESRDVPINDDL
jgi:hypothetical protein